ARSAPAATRDPTTSRSTDRREHLSEIGQQLVSRRRFVVRGTLALGALVLGCADITTPTPSPTRMPTAKPTSTPTTAPTPTPTGLADLRRVVGGLLVVGFRGKSVTPNDPILRAIRDLGLGGVILFAGNIDSPQQLADLTGALHAAAAPRRLIVSVDQEGGVVRRLTPAQGFDAVPSAATVGKKSNAYALNVGRKIGAQLAAAGINLNFAPVVDLDVNPANPSIGALGRSYSADPQIVTDRATATIAGEHEHDVRTTLKHFPGLGSATGDTDREFVDVTSTWNDTELTPYRNLIGAGVVDVVMTANALNGQIDTRYPASLSRATIDVLRNQLGYDGVAITDDLGAGAIKDSYSADTALRLAINAGNDLLLLANIDANKAGVAAASIDAIVSQVQAGKITQTRIASASTRVAALLSRLNGPA
ncbi:MAG: glycoside hydrolase family 3 N-terminal domain-containing protein, partial [Candidatus Limnocylindrales bacterium]